MPRIPRREGADDYSAQAAAERRAFAAERTGAALDHVGSFSFDPAVLPGNVESFLGVAQVPIGLAGPLLVDGEHAQGEFYVPLATTEGTLVASYSRGMKLMREAGGVKTTVVDDRMQRAPAFVFDDARGARGLGAWIREHFDDIRAAAEETTRSGRLIEIEQYQVGRILFCRFDYTTGDAAGQNMTGKATAFACRWIAEHWPGPRWERFQLEGGIATDKKHSLMNVMHTRGKRVVAEAVLPNELAERHLRASTRKMFEARQVVNIATQLGGLANNGPHAANGITALFIATGQDVANVAESHAGIAHAELRENGDYVFTVTLPALIVATYGGGTGLPTQRECLELLGCYGRDKVLKFAEIVAATVVCGDLSLGGAVMADEWVSSHDALGRNR
jgi:hydroxymethylglutaryl-CoA reductase (NADPH)